MARDPHGRARLLIDSAPVAGISADDERWLRGHTEGCAECADYAELTARIVHGLGSFTFEIDAGMNGRVKERLRVRLSANRRHPPMRLPRWALIAATLLILITPWTYVRRRQLAGARERADAALVDDVAARVSREIPRAMEPLVPGEVR